MLSVVTRTLLVAAALTQTNAVHPHDGVKEACGCAKEEADHPFAIDCADAATIRAATVTLEDTCTENNAGYEWGGAFATPANAYKWVAQAVEDGYAVGGPTLKYADPTMKLVIFDSHEADSEHLLEFAETAKTLMEGPCNTVVNTGGAILKPTAAGACYTLTFPTDENTDFHATINTMGVDNVAFFAEHGPTEFERDTHYLMSNGMTAQEMIDTTGGATLTGASAGLGPVEPGAETDAAEYNCKLLKNDSSQVKVCAQAFLIIQAHHDYCPHDTLTRYEEELFHEWEGKCFGCEIVRKYDPSLKKCPVIDCTDTTVAQLGYDHLKKECTAANFDYPFEWAGSFATDEDSYMWVSQAATDVAVDVAATRKKYADDYMKIAAFVMTDSNLKSELFGLKDSADALMSSGSCPEITATCAPGVASCASAPTITPTTAGVCYTIKFPDSSASLVDFHATIATAGIDHVAFFTAHLPTEFERDSHYFVSMNMQTDIEDVKNLGAPAEHDHGRRLSAVGRNARRSPRRLASSGECCLTATQQGAWKQVVSYHDECDHDQVPEYVEVGFHDYEASCEDHFCNLVEAGVDQTVCPSADSPKTCEEDLAQCNVDKTLNAAAVLGRLQAGTIKLVFDSSGNQA